MAHFPNSDGLYVAIDARQRVLTRSTGTSLLCFFEDGTVLVAGPNPDLVDALRMSPKAPTKGYSRGWIPAPVVVDGSKIAWTSQLGWSQSFYEGTWLDGSIELDVRDDDVRERRNFMFLSTEAIRNHDYEVAPPPAAPPQAPPADALDYYGSPYQRIVEGTGEVLGPKDRIRLGTTTWHPHGPYLETRECLVENASVLAAAPTRVGDVRRTWSQASGSVLVQDFGVSWKIDRSTPPPLDAFYVGPELDGSCLVARFLERSILSPYQIGVARVAATKLTSVLKWRNVAVVKDLFLMPAFYTMSGDHIRWTSQIAMDEQIAFEGTSTERELRMQLRTLRAGSDPIASSMSLERCTADELGEREKAAKRALKKKP